MNIIEFVKDNWKIDDSLILHAKIDEISELKDLLFHRIRSMNFEKVADIVAVIEVSGETLDKIEGRYIRKYINGLGMILETILFVSPDSNYEKILYSYKGLRVERLE